MRIPPLLLLAALLLPLSARAAEPTKAQLVLFVSADGVRWQDVFRGADESLMNKEAGGIRGTPNALRRKWWRPDATVRRQTLMPFLWSKIAKEGQVWGNRDAGSQCDVLNDQNFSYPGYSEFLCGHVDPRIKSNDAIPNENVTVLEWLHGRGATQGKVGAVNCWTVLQAIINQERSKIPMWTVGFPTPAEWASPVTRQINELSKLTPVPWSDTTWDSFVYTVAKDVLTRTKPKVLYVNFGEPDEWAHAARYDRYLDAVNNVDSFLAGLWEAAQSIPEYRGATTLIVTTDHGRGTGAKTWTSHGAEIPESKETWFAAVGPEIPALGERRDVPAQKTAGAAATIARMLGEDWKAAEPRAEAAWPILQP
ncbi:MAG: alkaline phosphatase family protein [Chthoniobacteraceae bacterium]